MATSFRIRRDGSSEVKGLAGELSARLSSEPAVPAAEDRRRVTRAEEFAGSLRSAGSVSLLSRAAIDLVAEEEFCQWNLQYEIIVPAMW